MTDEAIILNGERLTAYKVEAVARRRVPVELAPAALDRMERSRDVVRKKAQQGEVVYGVTTGFGKFADVVISPEQARDLQRNLILSHSVGVGPLFSEEAVRAMLLLRANALARGYSGIRVSVVQRLVDFLNVGVHPAIPQQGSLGASGDLAPLAHMTLALMGEGEVL